MLLKKEPVFKTLIAAGTRIEGNLQFDEGLLVDGEIIGDVRAAPDSHSMLVISEHALVQGAVAADHVIVNGTVRGPVRVRGLLDIRPKARIEGDVGYGALEFHNGAVLSGRLHPLLTETGEDEKTAPDAAANEG